jgi:hypothetical protein
MNDQPVRPPAWPAGADLVDRVDKSPELQRLLSGKSLNATFERRNPRKKNR